MLWIKKIKTTAINTTKILFFTQYMFAIYNSQKHQCAWKRRRQDRCVMDWLPYVGLYRNGVEQFCGIATPPHALMRTVEAWNQKGHRQGHTCISSKIVIIHWTAPAHDFHTTCFCVVWKPLVIRKTCLEEIHHVDGKNKIDVFIGKKELPRVGNLKSMEVLLSPDIIVIQ